MITIEGTMIEYECNLLKVIELVYLVLKPVTKVSIKSKFLGYIMSSDGVIYATGARVDKHGLEPFDEGEQLQQQVS